MSAATISASRIFASHSGFSRSSALYRIIFSSCSVRDSAPGDA
nr:hypothetical protein [Gordonia araii]